MYTSIETIRYLLSLPPTAARDFASLSISGPINWYASCDPPCGRVGSGGGTAHLLVEAWNAEKTNLSFMEWLNSARTGIIHGGGLSRRLPAYAASGKPLIPIPAMRWDYGQRMDQRLCDLQADFYRTVLSAATPTSRVLIGSGDVLMRFAEEIPVLPEADVIVLGLKVSAELAQHFGVFTLSSDGMGRLHSMLQKPEVDHLNEIALEHTYLVDTGLWLLSARAVNSLMLRCGWDEVKSSFPAGQPEHYELYSQFGAALGEAPTLPDPALTGLSCSVVELKGAEFYHLGTNRQMIESICALQNCRDENARILSRRSHPSQITQNSLFDPPVRRETNHSLWVENSRVPASWRIACEHVLTGVPENNWDIKLERGVCLDFVPVGSEETCVRAYGYDDLFRGAIAEHDTLWLGRPAPGWFACRGIVPADAGILPDTDIHDAAIFPILKKNQLTEALIAWLFAEYPEQDDNIRQLWLQAERISAREIGERINLVRLSQQQEENRLISLQTLHSNRASSVFHHLDLRHAAKVWATGDLPLPAVFEQESSWHERMWRANILRERGMDSKEEERLAFTALREAILNAEYNEPVTPICGVLDDQIVWARSPIRVDLAGGWTDTPPYCLQYGGRVANVALNLNGQPPIQVFARRSNRLEIVVRSIDMGAAERIETWEQLDTYSIPGGEFALGKAAMALAGYLPRFHAQGNRFQSLKEMLQCFGGGIEISMLAAIPAGSGLGTSSILSATLLGALNELCSLNWDLQGISHRTIVLEQMLTTGGGWQDQMGGILRGVKMLSTRPGPGQEITTRWLPDHLFSAEQANRQILLYYTGLTRMAKNILQEIVRGMFLNDSERLPVLREIGLNADVMADAIARNDLTAFGESIRRSWILNQRLDSGTNPPPVQAILERVQDHLLGAKLGGAGGGGYLLMVAKDEDSGRKIRKILTGDPPNDRARFVDISISSTGLEVTKS